MSTCYCNQCNKCPNNSKRQALCMWCWRGLCYKNPDPKWLTSRACGENWLRCWFKMHGAQHRYVRNTVITQVRYVCGPWDIQIRLDTCAAVRAAMARNHRQKAKGVEVLQ